MPRPRHITVSNSAADRAANTVRMFMAALLIQRSRPGEEVVSHEDWQEGIAAARVVGQYRAMHARPMARVTMGVRSMVRTARRDDSLRPGQRFKRLDRILDKLRRFPHMRLSQMEDIGGCRVVLPTLEEVYTVLHRIRHNWPDARITDYIDQPKTDGYRGIHVITRRDGRLIEVQLRTVGQHEWAETIEVYSPRVGFNLKDGEGPADLREYFKMAAGRIARQERGEAPDPADEAAFATLRERVLPYFQPRQ